MKKIIKLKDKEGRIIRINRVFLIHSFNEEEKILRILYSNKQIRKENIIIEFKPESVEISDKELGMFQTILDSCYFKAFYEHDLMKESGGQHKSEENEMTDEEKLVFKTLNYFYEKIELFYKSKSVENFLEFFGDIQLENSTFFEFK